MKQLFLLFAIFIIGVFLFNLSSDVYGSSSATIIGSTTIITLTPDQQLVKKNDTEATIDPNTPQLVVVDANASLSIIKIPSTVVAPTINYTQILNRSSNTVTISNLLTISQFNNGMNSVNTQVTLAPNTVIKGPSTWNGLINLPTIQSITSVSLPIQSEITNTITQVIEVGFGSTQLNLTNPAKLVFYGHAGQHVGFTHAGPLTEITTTCQNDAIPSGSNECKTDLNSDLVIYTNHFSSIGTWTSASSGSNNVASVGGGGSGVGASVGGGGGGGGGDGESTSAIDSSPGGVKIYQVSWDVCKNNMATILASTNGNPSTLGVLVRGTLGTTPAALSISQPYLKQNELANTHVLLYTAPLSPSETFFDAVAQDANNSVTKSITISGCGGSLIVSPLPWNKPPMVTSSATATTPKQSVQTSPPSNPNIPIPVIINNPTTQPTTPSTETKPYSTPQTNPAPQPQTIQSSKIEKQVSPQVVSQKALPLNQFLNMISNLNANVLKIPNLNMPDLKPYLENLIPKKSTTYALLGVLIVAIMVLIILIKKRKAEYIIINIETAFMTACTRESNKVIFPALYAYRRPSTIQLQPDKSPENENILMKAVGKQTKDLIDKYPSDWLGVSRPITHNGLFVNRTAFIAVIKEAIMQLGKSNKKLHKYNLIIGIPYGNQDAKVIHDNIINLLNPRDCFIVPNDIGSLIHEKSKKTILISVTAITTQIAFFDGYNPIAITRINEGCNYLTCHDNDKYFVDYDANEKIRWERVIPLAEMIFHELNLLRKQVKINYDNAIMTGYGTVIADGQLYAELSKKIKHLRRSSDPLFSNCFGLRKMQKFGRKEKQRILDLPIAIDIHVKDKFEFVSTKPELEEKKIAFSESKNAHQIMKERPINKIKKESSTKTEFYESESNQIDVVKKEIQEYRTALETIKNEYNSVLNQLENTKKEVEANRSELSNLQSERQSLILEIQSIKSEISNLHPKNQQEEFLSVKDKVDTMKNDLTSITAEMLDVTREYTDLRQMIESSRSELSEINHKIEDAKSEFIIVQSKKDMAEKEIRRAKNELAFIESELASVGKDEGKIMKAAGSMVAAINAKYEETKRDLEGLKAALAKIRLEYEQVKKTG